MPRTSHDSQTAVETTDDLSAQLRASEERIRELEAKVRLLEDRADRAERWVYKIWVEIEQKFFGGDALPATLDTLRKVIDRSFLGLGGTVKQAVLVQSHTNPKELSTGIDSGLVRW
jgi:uncharacterized protein YigA (DUF484 family)